MNDLLAVIYLICFALLAGGAFALMTQSLRQPAPVVVARQNRSKPNPHPEAPEPGEQVMYVDLSRERLESLYQQPS